jgi:hypothetical protein
MGEGKREEIWERGKKRRYGRGDGTREEIWERGRKEEIRESGRGEGG